NQTYDPRTPDTRYVALVPTLFRSSFTMPGFQGKLKAITTEKDSSGNPVAFTRWEAGQVLLDTIVSGPGGSGGGTATCADGATGQQCIFPTLTGKIKRHIYTTSHNGVFPVSVANFIDPVWV